MLKIILAITVMEIAVYISFCEFRDMKIALSAFEALHRFALSAEQNLRDTHDNIDNIITQSLTMVDNEEYICDFPSNTPFSSEIKNAISDYISDYKTCDITKIQKRSDEFIQYTKDKLDEQRSEQRKKLSSLLCPPAVAFMLVLLII